MVDVAENERERRDHSLQLKFTLAAWAANTGLV